MKAHLLLILLLALVLSVPTWAQEKTPNGEKRAEKKAEKKADGPAEMARIVFIKKDKAGKAQVWVRLTIAQYRRLKATAKVKPGSIERVILGPRQLAALHAALKQETGNERVLPKKIMLRVSEKRMKRAKGIKGHFVVRSLKQFLRKNPSDREPKEATAKEEGTKPERGRGSRRPR